MNRVVIFLTVIVLSFAGAGTYAQRNDSSSSIHRIAIFAPLYLDSAFDSMDNYRYEKNEFPSFINPGLEFYEGAQLALDSLSKQGTKLEVYVYDSRSAQKSIAQQLNEVKQNNVDLIIGHFAANEIRNVADFGQSAGIPVINANMPNDGGVRTNPFYVMLNPTLKTQCEGIYRFLQKYYAIDKLVVFRRKGQMEDMIKNIFEDFSKTTVSVPLKLKYVDLPDSFTVAQLRAHLDSNRQTICIAGSLNENFGRRLALQLASLHKKYPVTIVGMPTWDAIRDFNKNEFKGPEIIYSIPFYIPKTDRVSQSITNVFNSKMFARPSDMVYRGYEVTWKYGLLLEKFGKDINSNLTNRDNKVFTDFDVQPVLNTQTMSLDYFENKKLYFLRWQNGVIKAVN